MYGVDVERAEKLEKLARMAIDRDDRDTALKAMRAMKQIMEQTEAIEGMSTRERLTVLDAITLKNNPDIDTGSDDFIFRGLSDSEIEKVKSKVKPPTRGFVSPQLAQYGMSPTADIGPSELDQKTVLANLARLRKVNPDLAKVVDDMGPVDRLVSGAGAGVDTLLKGVGIGDVDADKKFYKDYLTSRSPSAAAGKLAAELSPFLVAGIKVPQLAAGLASRGSAASLAARTGAGGAVGGVEGNVIARGEGKDVAAGTAVGALAGVVGEAAVPLLRKAGEKLVSRLRNEGANPPRVVNDAGEVSPEFMAFLQENNIDLGDLMGASDSTLDRFAKASKPRDVQRVATTGRGGDDLSEKSVQSLEDLALRTKPSAVRAEAAEELGLGDVPVAVLSEDFSTQQLGGALAARPGTAIQEELEDFSRRLGVSADRVIEQVGGGTDKLQASASLRDRILSRRDELFAQENEAYDAVRQAINPRTIVNVKALRKQIEAEARNIGGVKNLEGPTARVYKILSGKPTYGLLDRERRLIGEALAKRRGADAYVNAAEGELNQLYSRLTELQEGVAEQLGAGDLWVGAKALTRERKALEEDSVALFGREVTEPLIPKIEYALRNLTGKGYKNFNDIIQRIPPEERPAVVASALNGVFVQGRGKNRQFSAGQFSAWWNELSRSPTARNALAEGLPPGGMDRLRHLATIAEAFSSATSVPRTGVVHEFLRRFDTARGLAGKLYGLARGVEAVPFLPMKTGASTFVSALAKAAQLSSTPAVEAIDNLISSREFRRYLQAAMTRPQSTAAKNLSDSLEKTDAYKNFVKSMSRSEFGKGSVGEFTSPAALVAWLTGDDDSDDPVSP